MFERSGAGVEGKGCEMERARGKWGVVRMGKAFWVVGEWVRRERT